MKRNIYYFIIALFIVTLISNSVYSENRVSVNKKESKESAGLASEIKNSKKLRLTIEKVLNYLLTQNLDVKKALLDYKSASSDIKKYQSKYNFNLYGKSSYSYLENSPENPSTLFQGAKVNLTNYEFGISKILKTGTTLSLSQNGQYQTSKAAKSASAMPFEFTNNKSYQSGIVLSLNQELLKNSFGFSNRKTEEKIANAVEMKKRAVKFYLSNLLVEALIGYWNVAVAEESLETARVSLKSTESIRDLVKKKRSLGLSEKEEVFDWESKVLQSKNATQLSEKYLYDARLAVIRTLNLDEGVDFILGKTFQKTKPKVTLEQALKDGMQKRVDINNQRTLVKNAELEYSIAKNEILPSLKLNLSAGNSDYSANSFGETLNDVNTNWSVGVMATYPLENTVAKVRLEDAEINYKKITVELKRLERDIKDQIDSIVHQCKVLNTVYLQTKESKELADKYYKHVLKKFKQGRYSAVQIKLALDSYIQMRQSELRSLIDYNIALLRRDLARNVIFEKYDIEVDAILEKYKLS